MYSGKYIPVPAQNTASTAEFGDCSVASPWRIHYTISAVSENKAIWNTWSVLLREDKKNCLPETCKQVNKAVITKIRKTPQTPQGSAALTMYVVSFKFREDSRYVTILCDLAAIKRAQEHHGLFYTTPMKP